MPRIRHKKNRRGSRSAVTVRSSRGYRFWFMGLLTCAAMAVVYCSSKERVQDNLMNVRAERKALPAEAPVEDMPPLDFKTAFFAFDSSVLTSDGKKALKPAADWLKRNPDVTVQLEGYCDERGSEAYNLVLGEKRAKAAKAYFVGQGIDSERITVLSYGRVEGGTDGVRAQNRRAGVVMIYPRQPDSRF